MPRLYCLDPRRYLHTCSMFAQLHGHWISPPPRNCAALWQQRIAAHGCAARRVRPATESRKSCCTAHLDADCPACVMPARRFSWSFRLHTLQPLSLGSLAARLYRVRSLHCASTWLACLDDSDGLAVARYQLWSLNPSLLRRCCGDRPTQTNWWPFQGETYGPTVWPYSVAPPTFN